MSRLIVTLRKTEDVDNILDLCKQYDICDFRINLARSNIKKNLEVLGKIKKRIKEPNIYLDIPGNKNRISKFAVDSVSVTQGEVIELVKQHEDGLFVIENNDDFFENTNNGDCIVFGDNDVKAKVEEVNKHKVILSILQGNRIKSHTGYINISNYKPMNYIEPNEIEMIKQFDDKNVIWDISFADTVERIDACKKYIKKGEVVAKIETDIGIHNLVKIAKCVDGIMLARGDLNNFYEENKINGILFEIMKEVANLNSIKLLVATNIFKSIAMTGRVRKVDEKLIRMFVENSDYIISNETSYTNYWKEIIDYYRCISD